MALKKYSFRFTETIIVNGETIKAQRIMALRDIPLHRVKKGDIGGYISAYTPKGLTNNLEILSHKGNAWIGEDAIVIGNVRVGGNAWIGGKSIVTGDKFEMNHLGDGFFFRMAMKAYKSGIIKGNAKIRGQAFILMRHFACITDDVTIGDKAVVVLKNTPSAGNRNCTINGKTTIGGVAYIDGVSGYISDCYFAGNVIMKDPANLYQVSFSEGEHQSLRQTDYDLRNVIGAVRPEVQSKPLETYPIISSALSQQTLNFAMSSKDEKSKKKLLKVETSFNSYQHDIVKLIKYPLMADLSNPDILNFVHALNGAKTHLADNDMDGFGEAVEQAERLFLVAESKVRISLDTTFDAKGQDKLKTAKNLLAIAYNDGSSENEKKISCERVLKELKGVIPLEDKLVENLRASVGLKELEA